MSCGKILIGESLTAVGVRVLYVYCIVKLGGGFVVFGIGLVI